MQNEGFLGTTLRELCNAIGRRKNRFKRFVLLRKGFNEFKEVLIVLVECFDSLIFFFYLRHCLNSMHNLEILVEFLLAMLVL